MRAIACIALLLILCAPITVKAQSSRFVVTATAGSYQTNAFAISHDMFRHVFYPELQVDARLVAIPHSSAALRGGVFWGYYDDGVNEPSHSCVDCATYSMSSHTVGARLILSLFDSKTLPIGLSAGIARQFITARHVGGRDWVVPPERMTLNSNVAVFGLQVRVPVYRALKIHLAARRFIALPMHGDVVNGIAYGDRHLLQAGLSYGIH
ncbi:MAG TPA: hypothetical protein VFG50_09100 [Rhodothermales bacterium]|nr:hypothetical protein [Rhodothermales bacterium]